jgi:hypothetical protein
MAPAHTTRNQRRLSVGLVAVAAILGLGLGVAAMSDDESEPASVESAATTERPTETTTATETTEPTKATEAAGTDPTTTSAGAEAVSDSDTVAAQDIVGTTEACRADPTCPSSEHRTGDLCGATLILDTAGYLEGRQDAEQGLADQVDHAPAPDSADDDDDDGTVGPQTRYRAGYAQGWCDGGGTDPGAG